MHLPLRFFTARFFFISLLLVAAGCGGNFSIRLDENGSGSSAGESLVRGRSAESAAHLVLSRYRRKNAFALSTMATDEQREFYRDLNRKKEKNPRWSETFGGWRGRAVAEWSGRTGPARFWREGDAYKACVRFAGAPDGSVTAVTLRLVDRRWKFERIERLPVHVWRTGAEKLEDATELAAVAEAPPAAPPETRPPAGRPVDSPPRPIGERKEIVQLPAEKETETLEITQEEERVSGSVPTGHVSPRPRREHPKVAGIVVESNGNDGPDAMFW